MKPIDRRKHDEDIAERMSRGARVERVHSRQPDRDAADDKPSSRSHHPSHRDERK